MYIAVAVLINVSSRILLCYPYKSIVTMAVATDKLYTFEKSAKVFAEAKVIHINIICTLFIIFMIILNHIYPSIIIMNRL